MKKQIKIVLYVIMAISLACCMFVGVTRIQAEQANKEIEIAVKYSDILRTAIDEEISLEDALKKFKDMGVTTLLVRENTVASPLENDYYSYKGLGALYIIDGYILNFYYPDMPGLNLQSRYIVTNEEEVAKNISRNYSVKDMEMPYTEYAGDFFLEIGDHSKALTVVGVGFDTEALNLAAHMGFSISLQLKTWDEMDEASIENVMQEIEEIDNVNTIYFADSEVIDGETPEWAEFISDKYQLGFVEFTSNKQKGFGALAKKTSDLGTAYKVVRLHTLEDSKVNTFEIPQLISRYDLALEERGNRVFLFKMPNTDHLDEDIEYLEEAITTFTNDAIEDGYQIVSDVKAYNLPPVSGYILALAGLAAIVIFILLMEQVGFAKLGYIFGLLGLLGYVGLLKLNTNIACQLMALFGSIMFPTYAVATGLREQPRNIKETLYAFIKICAISFGGTLTIIGVLSRTNFALGIDLFMGVKAATTVPIVLVLVYLVYKAHQCDLKFYMGLLDKKISYGALILMAIVGGVLLIYVTRSGNSGSTSTLELAFRQLLDNVLGVRPRTKEILIGYPILLALLYFGYKERYIVFVIFAIMGPISLVNTYAHIHTPILISLIRSGYGIIIGIIVGLILIWLITLLNKVIKKWQIQLK